MGTREFVSARVDGHFPFSNGHFPFSIYGSARDRARPLFRSTSAREGGPSDFEEIGWVSRANKNLVGAAAQSKNGAENTDGNLGLTARPSSLDRARTDRPRRRGSCSLRSPTRILRIRVGHPCGLRLAISRNRAALAPGKWKMENVRSPPFVSTVVSARRCFSFRSHLGRGAVAWFPDYISLPY